MGLPLSSDRNSASPYPKPRNEDSPYRDCASDNVQGRTVNLFSFPASFVLQLLFLFFYFPTWSFDLLSMVALPSLDSENGLHIMLVGGYRGLARRLTSASTGCSCSGRWSWQLHFSINRPNECYQFSGYCRNHYLCRFSLGSKSLEFST